MSTFFAVIFGVSFLLVCVVWAHEALSNKITERKHRGRATSAPPDGRYKVMAVVSIGFQEAVLVTRDVNYEIFSIIWRNDVPQIGDFIVFADGEGEVKSALIPDDPLMV